MKKLFENVSGNRFKLLTESVNGQEHVLSGLKKVFSSDLNEISYKRVESVGLGYIKDVSTAQRVSLEAAKQLAESFGYKDNESQQKFVKEEDAAMPSQGHGQEEKREVQIGKELLQIVHRYKTANINDGLPEEIAKECFTRVDQLAQELLQLRGQK